MYIINDWWLPLQNRAYSWNASLVKTDHLANEKTDHLANEKAVEFYLCHNPSSVDL